MTDLHRYLFYVLTGPNLGLHRLDLGQVSHLWSTSLTPMESQAHRTRVARPELILSMPDLYTAVIDLASVHLYAVNNANQSMVTTFLDGTNRRSFHDDIYSSSMRDVTSMVYFNQVSKTQSLILIIDSPGRFKSS